MALNTRIIQLPRKYTEDQSKCLPILVLKSKTLRLKALQTDPSAWGSTYEREVVFEDSVWEDRLRNPLAVTFVAVDTSSLSECSDDLEALKTAEWTGMTVLFGPQLTNGTIPTANISAWFRSGSGFEQEEDEKTTQRTVVYAINAVYVHIPYRGRGIAKKLLEVAFQLAVSDFKNSQRFEGDVGICMLFVEKYNDAALGLYLKSGFELIGEETYTGIDGRKGIALSLQRHLVD